MLTHIHIKNFAIVDKLDIEFTENLSVLTGETGAGKSLWVDAVQLALGQRADLQWIRAGCDRADISVTLDISNQPQAIEWLKNEELFEDNDCIIRRTLTRKGTSRNTINGAPMPLQRIRAFADLLVQIHSQHQQQHLLQSDKQRQSVDYFAGNQSLLKSIKALYQQWQTTQAEIIELLGSTKDKDQEIEFLKYQLTELNALSLKAGEWETLSKQHQKLHNAKHLVEQLNQAINFTIEHEEHSASQLIQQAIQELEAIKVPDNELTAIKELLSTAAIHLNEAGSGLQSYRDHFDKSGLNVGDIESRLGIIYDLSRKHHCNPEDLHELHHSLQKKLDTLLNLDEKINALKHHQAELIIQYKKLAEKLTDKRKKSAKKLEKHISASMQEMDIQDGAFKVSFEAITDEINPTGQEKIQFLVQTNAGQGFQSLQKIASGGEISRISLALHVLTATQEQTPTLIFDEVDVGISGKTAAIVGKLLRQLGEKTQVLCITHLPQVASHAHHHYKVTKQSDGKQTRTQIEKLNKDNRIKEIARLLGGEKVTKQSIAHASELLVS